MSRPAKPELLAPAGDLEKLKVAFAYGADAVYIGGQQLSMRANAKNFSPEEMAEGISHAHALGKKVYVAANIFAHNADFTGIADYFIAVEKMGADALIISDVGVFTLAKSIVPDMELHVSTQANVTNFAAAAFWQGAGAARIILARELSMREIRDINRKVPEVKLEGFVHGAMCMAYSGRCLISNYLHARDANGGDCIQPCRWDYTLTETKSGETLPITQDERGAYIFNARDMCMIRHIPELVYAGIESFKIEGRMKTAYYVAATVKAYREAIDDHHQDAELYESRLDHYTASLARLGQSRYSTGFYFGKPNADDHGYDGEHRSSIQDFLAIVESYDPSTKTAIIEQRNKFSVGDEIEIFRPTGEVKTERVYTLRDEKGADVASAPHPKQKLKIKLDTPVQKYDILRRKCKCD